MPSNTTTESSAATIIFRRWMARAGDVAAPPVRQNRHPDEEAPARMEAT
jgi:hypothetical protein